MRARVGCRQPGFTARRTFVLVTALGSGRVRRTQEEVAQHRGRGRAAQHEDQEHKAEAKHRYDIQRSIPDSITQPADT